MTDSRRLPTYEMYTIGWIAALDKELTAALAMLDETHQQPDDFEQNDKDSNSYSWGRIGDHNIVIASLGGGSYGLVSAATTATCMANSIPNLRFGLMVGIGAGVPNLEEDDVRLGDVVVSLPKNGHPGVIQYDIGKMTERDHFQRVGALAPPPTILLKALDKLRASHRLKGSKLPHILSRTFQSYPMLANPKGKDPAFIYQGAENDRLFEPTSVHISSKYTYRTVSEGGKRYNVSDSQPCSDCDVEREIKREQRPTNDPEIHYGTIASGNIVVKDGVFRDRVSEQIGTDVLCYEMEAAGLMNNFPCLVIRGICDYADTHKNDRWQNYAAIVAAAYVKELLSVIETRSVEKAKKIEEAMATVSRAMSRIESTTNDTQKVVQDMNQTQLHEKIVTWLAAPDPSRDQNAAFQQHHVGTGQWLLKSEAYQQWKIEPASCIWLYGIPGCGKTVLSSAIIRDLEGFDTPDQHIIFFYFTFTDVAKQSLDGAIRSLITQLCSKSEAACEQLTAVFNSEYRIVSKQPSTKSLCEIFERMIKVSGRIWIVLDALDECELGRAFANEGLLIWLKGLLDHKHCNLHTIVTSRHEIRIQKILEQCVIGSNQISLQSGKVDRDIRAFVDAAVSTWTASGVWQAHRNVEQEIKHYLATNAHGMFRWVSCQLDALEPLAGSRNDLILLDTLRSLPKTLDDTYARILQRIPDRLQKGAQRVLQFLIHSEEPLKVDEAIEIALLSPEAERSRRRVNTLIKPDIQEVLLYCPNLVKTVTQRDILSKTEEEVLQLSHFSVKEYLLSERSDRQTFWTSEEGHAKASMADICLAYLLDIPRGRSVRDVMSSYPLAQHAASFWVDYARQANNKMSEGLIKELVLQEDSQMTYAELRSFALRNSRSTFKRQLPRVFNVNSSPEKPKVQRNANFSPEEPDTLLYHFASYGVLCAVKIILEICVNDLDIWSSAYDKALQDAAFQGYSDIVEELLRRGANVNAQSRDHSSVLAVAVENSYEETVEILLRHNADTNVDQDILHKAVYRGNIRIINLLLTHGATISQRAFCLACENGESVIVSMLLRHIRDTSVASYCSYAFPRICGTGQYGMVQKLMRNNADIDTKDSDNLTGLYLAASKGHSNIVELLLRTGAKLSQEGDFKESPLSATVANGNIDIMRLLLAKDDHAELFNVALIFAVSSSASCNRPATVALLLETFKAKYQIKPKQAILTEALHAAISTFEEGYDEIVKLLLENGADVNANVGSRINVLHYVSEKWETIRDKESIKKVVYLLLDHGLDPNERYGTDRTSFETAVWARNWELANILANKCTSAQPHYEVWALVGARRHQLQETQRHSTTEHHVIHENQT